MGSRYRKEDLEQIVVVQLDNLNVQGEHIELLKRNNELLHEYNKFLLDKITPENEKPKPYPRSKKRKTN